MARRRGAVPYRSSDAVAVERDDYSSFGAGAHEGRHFASERGERL